MAVNNPGAVLPVPFLLEPPDRNNMQPFHIGDRDAGHQLEESFEHFIFPAPTRKTPAPKTSVETLPPKILKAKRTTHTRNYKLYAGKTIFFCGGRFLSSRAFWAFCLSLFLMMIPCVLFLVFTCPWLWYHVSPAVIIIFAYMFVLAIASMFKTSWTDPGILPRNLDRKYMEDRVDHRDEDRYGYRYSSMSDQSTLPLPKDVTIKGVPVRLKYCDTCYIYRPPRASHCRQCDNCVENEDHHCIWLNNCIGKRNYTSFFTFITCCTLLLIYVISFSLTHVIWLCLQTDDKSFLKAITQAPLSFFVALYCFLLLIPVGCLTGYHCFLVMRGVTTHEQLRSSLASVPFEDHPFNFGNPLKNMIHVLCRPHNKSYIGRRKYAEEIYDVQREEPPSASKANIVIAASNLSTIPDDFGPVSTLDIAAATSNIPLQNR